MEESWSLKNLNYDNCPVNAKRNFLAQEAVP
jgi:hypothetical protein